MIRLKNGMNLVQMGDVWQLQLIWCRLPRKVSYKPINTVTYYYKNVC